MRSGGKRRSPSGSEESIMIKVKDSTEFNQLLIALWRDIVQAHSHYQLYKDLKRSLQCHPHVEAWFKNFWGFTINAHLDACMYRLCRIYDQGNKALHLHSWLLTIKENLDLFDE